jgi:nitroreductase
MADIYRSGMQIRASQLEAAADSAPGAPAVPVVTPARERMAASAAYLVDHLHEVPVLVVPAIAGRLDGADIATQASRWGSILPSVWSFMLALRARGMGSVWTTVHLFREGDMAELLGIPDDFTQAGLFPVAYTVGTDFRRGTRDLSAESVRWNRW